ncbi:MAG: type VI secretion system membrane subunit TssM [Rhodocyclaceae bacterium]
MSRMRLFLSLLGLAAAAAVVWFAGPLLVFAGHAVLDGETARLVLILAMVVAWAVVVVRRVYVARRANEQIAAGISAPPPPDATAQAEEDLLARSEAEATGLDERFREAVAALRATRKQGALDLYQLPWYVVIGPPGAGKSTILANSGLRFPLAERFGPGALRGVGGTRQCDWWFTDDAILLDTAGRFFTQDSDRVVDATAWATFLALLKQYRRRRPINGVVLAISLVDVIAQNSEARAVTLAAVRQRMDELHAEFGLRLPVYIVFTKSDLVAGFTEFFDDLGKEERAQVWGTTFAADEAETAAAFAREYDGLLGRLNVRLLARLDKESDPRRRALVFTFPQQVASLKEAVSGFVADVVRATRYEAPLWVRGVYFTSGTQEGTPIDRIMGGLARALGLDAQRVGPRSSSGRSYFVADLLQRVIFPEAELVGTNPRLERRRAWLHAFGYGAMACALVAAIAVWSMAYTRNQADMARLAQRVDNYEAIAATPLPASASFDEVLPRLDAICAAADVYPGSAGAYKAIRELGLYQGTRLGSAARRACLRELNRLLVPTMAASIAGQLRASGRETDLQYAALKAYLMLSQPEHRDPAFFKAWMQFLWETRFARAPQTVQALSAYLDTLLAEGLDPVTLEEDLVKETRLALNRLPLAQVVYGRLKNAALTGDEKPLRLPDLLGPGGGKVFVSRGGIAADQAVPRLFTRDGYLRIFLPESKRLTSTIRGESWVLGQDENQLNVAELARLDQGVADLYFAEYARRWQNLLADLQIVALSNPAQGLEVLAFLSGRNSELRTLLQAVERNTALTRPEPATGAPEGKLDGVLQKAKEDISTLLGPKIGARTADLVTVLPGVEVEQRFAPINALLRVEEGKPAAIDAITEQLAALYADLDSDAGPGTADPVRRAEGAAARRLKETAIAQPQPVKDWLLQLAGATEDVAAKRQNDEAQKQRAENKKDLLAKINAAWSADVFPFCVAAAANRYPIDKRSGAEATLKDFGRLFGPGGLIDAFVKDHLKAFIDSSARPWRWRGTKDIDFDASAEALRQIEIAALIRDAYFRDGSQVPAVDFTLKPILFDKNAKEVTLDIGGQKLAFRPGAPVAQTVHWPAPGGAVEAQIRFEDLDGKTASKVGEGAWALWRLFDSARLEKGSGERIVATFTADGQRAQFEIRAGSVFNPFQQEGIERFRCPKAF